MYWLANDKAETDGLKHREGRRIQLAPTESSYIPCDLWPQVALAHELRNRNL